MQFGVGTYDWDLLGYDEIKHELFYQSHSKSNG